MGETMKPPFFQYLCATSVNEVVEALVQNSDEAKILAGGQSLVPMLNLRITRPSLLIDITRIASLKSLEFDEQRKRLVIGAAVTQTQVEQSVLVQHIAPLLSEALSHVAHLAIRNLGTLVGNAVHADPASEVPAVLLALDATFIAVGPQGGRAIQAKDFYVSTLTTALEPDELVTRIELAATEDLFCSSWLEVARTHGSYALVGVGCQLILDDLGAGHAQTILRASIALCGVSETPIRASDAEITLVGQSITDYDRLDHAAEMSGLDLHPTSDTYASAHYRRELATVLTRRALYSALARLNPSLSMESPTHGSE
jgi:carbon-monoxide dehydrogenase medium subunit